MDNGMPTAVSGVEVGCFANSALATSGGQSLFPKEVAFQENVNTSHFRCLTNNQLSCFSGEDTLGIRHFEAQRTQKDRDYEATFKVANAHTLIYKAKARLKMSKIEHQNEFAEVSGHYLYIYARRLSQYLNPCR